MSLHLDPSAFDARASGFAALGDPTRLTVLNRLLDGRSASISHLTTGTTLTRQAITKHLHVLQEAGFVTSRKDGRETLFSVRPEPLIALRDYLDAVAAQWDQALARLKAHVENGPP